MPPADRPVYSLGTDRQDGGWTAGLGLPLAPWETEVLAKGASWRIVARLALAIAPRVTMAPGAYQPLFPIPAQCRRSIDLSPVRASSGGPPVPIFKLLHNTIERRVPDWVEQGRRLGALLIGVGSQSGRPFSLSHEWAPIAEEALFLLDEHGNSAGLAETTDRPREANKVRLKTHLTGLT
eukprot:scaffold73908_cov35-Tisochrysis_lutea.AAC.5